MNAPKEEYLYLEYLWEDDQTQGDNKGTFIGTWSEWEDCVKDWEEGWGFAYCNLKTRPATEEEIETLKHLKKGT